jgi:hypothetical protein
VDNVLEVDGGVLKVGDEAAACTRVEVAAYSEAGIEDTRQRRHGGV